MFELTERALKLVLDEFVKYLKNSIATKRYPYGNPQRGQGDKIASGTLYDSIQGDVEIDALGANAKKKPFLGSSKLSITHPSKRNP